VSHRSMADTPRLLVVDDDPAMLRLVEHLLAGPGLGPISFARSGREALEALDGIDIVLLDNLLPDARGLDILDLLRARPNPPAVVFITAHGNEALAATALRRGADDYLPKDSTFAELLPQIIERVRRNRELRKTLVAAERDFVRAERLAAIGEMAVTLNHGINNPLMAAFADVDLLLAEPAWPADHRQTLEGLKEALERIRDIMRQIGDLRAVRTKTYVAGIRMVDLQGGEPAAPVMHRGIALVLVPEHDLARVIALLLRHAGFGVEQCETVADLQRSVERLGVSLVVLAGGTDVAGVHSFGGFLPPASRAYRVVALVAGDGTAARAAGADRVIQLPFDPGTFTADMVNLTG